MFLNDVTVDADGVVYVSDTATNTIHRWTPGDAPEVVLQDPTMQAPNGLYVDGRTIVVGSIGSIMPDEIVAPLFTFDLDDGTLTQFGALTAKFDGVEADGDDLLVTDFRGELHRVTPDGQSALLRDFVAADGLMSSVDFGFDPVRRMVAIPDFAGGQVAFWTLRE